MHTTVIIPAAGSGKRFGADIPKQYLDLKGLPVIVHTLRVFEQTPSVFQVILAASPDFMGILRQFQREYSLNKITAIISGGAERQDSIWNALQHPHTSKSDLVLVHDAVRPFITPDFITTLIIEAERFGAVVPGNIPKETVKHISPDGRVHTPFPREQLRLIQTPQAFQREILLESYRYALQTGFRGTDDASLVEYAGYAVRVIQGLESNLKITTREDWLIAETLLQQESP